jgi:hypothetical protein
MSQRIQVFVLAVIAVMVMASISTAPVSAQSAGNATTTAPEDDPVAVADQLGDLVIHDYEYRDGPGVMVIEATWTDRAPTTLTLTEIVTLDSGGSATISFKQVRLMPDERTEIRIAVDGSDGVAAVLLTTPASVDQDEALILQEGAPTDDPFAIFEGVQGLLVGVGVSVTMAFLAALVLLRRESDGVEVAD